MDNYKETYVLDWSELEYINSWKLLIHDSHLVPRCCYNLGFKDYNFYIFGGWTTDKGDVNELLFIDFSKSFKKWNYIH